MNEPTCANGGPSKQSTPAPIAEHCWQAIAPAPMEKLPGGQRPEHTGEESPSVAPKVPAEQGIGADDPVGQKEPRLQGPVQVGPALRESLPKKPARQRPEQSGVIIPGPELNV